MAEAALGLSIDEVYVELLISYSKQSANACNQYGRA